MKSLTIRRFNELSITLLCSSMLIIFMALTIWATPNQNTEITEAQIATTSVLDTISCAIGMNGL